MKAHIYAMILAGFALQAEAQDTFSITATDSATGEVGSAGASCLDDDDIAGGVFIISDVLPGKGVIHTQSFWNESNQKNARKRMEEGMAPDEIIDWLQENDHQLNPTVRQYGISDFDADGRPRSAAFTGEDCFDYKNHIVAPSYSIQGNILLGQSVLDSMESRFLRTKGSLAHRLMAALQGANVPGADTRCLEEGVSSQSAFIRVAKADDSPDNLHLDLLIAKTPEGVEPIDELQKEFDTWSSLKEEAPYKSISISVYPNPGESYLTVSVGSNQQAKSYMLELKDMQGRLLHIQAMRKETRLDLSAFSSGSYQLLLKSQGQIVGYKRVSIQ